MLGWIIAIASVALPVLGFLAWGMKDVVARRGFERLVRAQGWTVSRGSPARTAGPLRRLDEKVERTITGTYRGRPFAWYQYARPGAVNADGTRDGDSLRIVVHIEVTTQLPRWELTVGSRQVVCPDDVTLRPELEDWITSGRYRTVYLSDHTIAVQLKGTPSGKRFLETLDFLNGIADRLPLY